MYMKNLVMAISIQNKFYVITHDDKNNILIATSLDKNNHFCRVIDEEEINFIRSIIEKNIRKVYIELDKISFENEEYILFQNRYNFKFYFALAKDKERKILSYYGNEKLYDYYNPKNIVYAYDGKRRRNSKTGQNYNNHNYGFDDESPYGFEDEFGNDMYGDYPGRLQPKKRNPALRIAIAVGGVVGSAIITITGLKMVTNSKFPLPFEKETTVTAEAETTEYSGGYTEYENIANEELTEEQLELKEKYERIKAELEEQGIQPWEVAIVLSHIKEFNYYDALNRDKNAKPEQIDFYYDEETNSVIFVYEEIDRELVKDTAYDTKEKNNEDTSYEYESLSEDVKTLIDAVNSNPNLSDEDKKRIIETWANKWQRDADYVSFFALRFRLNELTIHKEYDKGSIDIEVDGNPHAGAIGIYHPSTNEIELFDETAYDHEVGHVMGDLGWPNTLLSEGYNEWKNGSNSAYENERYMAYAFEEVFGAGTLKEGYYSKNLYAALTDKLVEETGMERDEAIEIVDNLLYDTQNALYDLGLRYDQDKKTAFDDPDLQERFDSIMERLQDINSKLGNPKNYKVIAIQDYFTNNKDSIFTQNEDEEILSFNAMPNGDILLEIGKSRDIAYYGGSHHIFLDVSRYKYIGKDSENAVDKIYDNELGYSQTKDYLSQSSDKTEVEGKDGFEDCMEDENIKLSFIQRIKYKFSKTFKKDKDEEK